MHGPRRAIFAPQPATAIRLQPPRCIAPGHNIASLLPAADLYNLAQFWGVGVAGTQLTEAVAARLPVPFFLLLDGRANQDHLIVVTSFRLAAKTHPGTVF